MADRWSKQSALPLLALLLVLGAAFFVAARTQDQAVRGSGRFEAGGFTTSASVEPLKVVAGSRASIRASVTSGSAASGNVDVEVFGSQRRSYQQFFENQLLPAGKPTTYSVTWDVPVSEPAGSQTVKVGVFRPGWTQLAHWNDDAATFRVVTAARGQAVSQAGGAK